MQLENVALTQKSNMNELQKLIGVGAMVWPAVVHGGDKKKPIFP